MRLEFFRLRSTKDVLYWDLTDDGYSAMTGGRTRAITPVEGEILCYEEGFFINPTHLARVPPPELPAPSDVLLSWMIKCRLFGPISTLRIMMGNAETLRSACRSTPRNFPKTLTGFFQIQSERNKVEEFLEDCRKNGGHFQFLDNLKEQGEKIANYQAEGVPRVTDISE